MKKIAVFALFLLLLLSAAPGVNAQSWAKAQEIEPNFFAIRQQFLDFWEGKTRGPGEGHSVFRRWEWFWESRVLPDGSFPPANINSVEWRKYRNQLPKTEGFSAANWTSMGPNSSASGYNGIGRVNAVVIDPNNDDIIWVGTPSGGLWKSENGGQSWTTNTDSFTVLGVSAILIDPFNTDIMYIGTGDAFSSDTRSIGVLKSTDGGVSWQPTSLQWNVTSANYIRAMIMHPTETGTILAAASGGLYRTTNAGASWTRVYPGDFYDVKFNPADPSIVYAATNNRLLRSANTGATWTIAQTITGSDRIALAVTPADPTMVAAVVSSAISDEFGAFHGLYVSTNSGSSYTQRSDSPNVLGSAASGNSVRGQGWYDLCIAVSPTIPDVIIVGGVNLWISVDGGITWSLMTHWRNSDAPGGTPVVHADKHALTWKGETLFLGCDGGVYKTDDYGGQWTDLSSNLVISQMYRLGVSQSDEKVITGLQDNGTKLRSNAGVWTDNIGGDGMECFIHPTNSNIMYGELQYGGIRRSTNGGATWSNIHNNVPGQPEGAWVTPFVMDPNVSATIYVGYNDVYKSTNQGTAWTAISTNLSPNRSLRHIAIAPADSKIIYASDGYIVYRTIDGGVNWENVTGTLPGSPLITYLTVDPENADHVLVTFGSYTSGRKVYRSTTGGADWTNISGSLPNLPANCVIVQPNSFGVLYLAMDVGVYRWDAITKDWTLYNDGLPNVPVTELEIKHNTGKLRASTYGRGLWESDLAPVISPCAVPANLIATDVNLRAARFQWDTVNSGLNYQLDIRKAGAPDWHTFSDLPDNSAQLAFLKPCTTYEYRVQAGCADVPSEFTTVQQFSTPGCSAYCLSYGNGDTPALAPQQAEWIEQVKLGDIAHNSGYDWGYNDFTALSTELMPGETYTITLTPGFSTSPQTEGWSVWIDFNQNNDFSDPGEQVATHPGSTEAVTLTFAVPALAAAGNTRMRVSMQRDAVSGPCDAPFALGEVEDYTVQIAATAPVLTADPTSLNFTADGGELTLTLMTNCIWAATDIPAWLSVSPASGFAGITIVTLTATDNSSTSDLSAVIGFSGCDGQAGQDVIVTQAAAPVVFQASPVEYSVAYTEGCVELVINSNTNWTASSVDPWVLSITPASGTGNDTLEICYAANTDTLARSAAILLLPTGPDSVWVVLTQLTLASRTNSPGSHTGNGIFCTPNPARNSTLFRVYSGRTQTIQLDVFGPDGRLVYTYGKVTVQAGETALPWQTADLPAGQYTYRCRFEQETIGGRLVLAR